MPGLRHSRAPWVDDEVASLNAFQTCGYHHPFTWTDGSNLVATERGWVAGSPGMIVQTWTHDYMTDWSWKRDPLESAHNKVEAALGSLEKRKTSDEDLTVVCSCSRLDHAVRFSRIDDSHYVEVTFIKAPFWRRAKTAWNYLFGKPCGYEGVSEVELSEASFIKLTEWCTRGLGFKKLAHDPIQNQK